MAWKGFFIRLLASIMLVYATFKVRQDFETGPLFKVLYYLITDGYIPDDIDIFATMSRGYTVDLVMISGFWASYNALRVIRHMFIPLIIKA